MVERAQRNVGDRSTPFQLRTTWVPDRGLLKFVSLRQGDGRGSLSGGAESLESTLPVLGAMLDQGALRAIEWDHSAVDKTVPFAVKGTVVGSLSLGDQGVYRFPALSVLARSRPTELAEALRAILRQAPARS